MARTVEQVAEAASTRVPSGAVGFDPVTIITIFTAVIPIITQCFMRNEEDDPDQVAASVKEAHERHPRALLRRTANRIYRTSTTPVSKVEAEELARALIAETIATPDDDVAAFCRTVRP